MTLPVADIVGGEHANDSINLAKVTIRKFADSEGQVIPQEQADTLAAPADSAAALLDDAVAADSLSQANYVSLFSYLMPLQMGNNPLIGFAFAKDRDKVEEMLASDKVRRVLPHDLRLLWGVKPIKGVDAARYGIQCNPKELLYELIAIKQTSSNGRAPLEGDVITNARSQVSQSGKAEYEVSMSMNSDGARKWAHLTKQNLGKSIAIVLDGFVYSYPTVQSEITGGNSQITGNFTTEEAQDLANVLKSGKLPAPATIVEDTVVGPSLGQERVRLLVGPLRAGVLPASGAGEHYPADGGGLRDGGRIRLSVHGAVLCPPVHDQGEQHHRL